MSFRYRVSGLIREQGTRRPLLGLVVRGFDADVVLDDLLGETRTDAEGHFEIVFTQRSDTPADDLMTSLLRAEHDGDRLTREEIVTMVANLLVGGPEAKQARAERASECPCAVPVLGRRRPATACRAARWGPLALALRRGSPWRTCSGSESPLVLPEAQGDLDFGASGGAPDPSRRGGGALGAGPG
jgi:hypothetical protein